MRLITIEGNIAVGKSSLIHKLKEKFKEDNRVIFITEPVEDWLSHGFLQGMYTGTVPTQGFQHMVLSSMAAELISAIFEAPCIIIQERSLKCTYEVFAKANLRDIDLRLFEYSCDKIIKSIPLKVSHIYLRLDVETLLQRAKARNRESEDTIPVNYIRELNRLHDEWLLHDENTTVIHAENDIHVTSDIVEKIIHDSLK
jgi:deoxyadenosine/deoxycytidine kinase